MASTRAKQDDPIVLVADSAIVSGLLQCDRGGWRWHTTLSCPSRVACSTWVAPWFSSPLLETVWATQTIRSRVSCWIAQLTDMRRLAGSCPLVFNPPQPVLYFRADVLVPHGSSHGSCYDPYRPSIVCLFRTIQCPGEAGTAGYVCVRTAYRTVEYYIWLPKNKAPIFGLSKRL